MRENWRSFLAVFTVTICCLLALPMVASANEVVLLEKVWGPGTHVESITAIPVPVRPTDNRRYVPPFRWLRSVSISVENGSLESKHRVASAQVFLNGEEIFDQNDFNNHYTSMSDSRFYPEGLQRIDLRVRVNGNKMSQLKVIVKGTY